MFGVVATLALATITGCVRADPVDSVDGPLAVELLATRSVMANHSAAEILVDSLFAWPDQAPSPPTRDVRPAGRQRELQDAMTRDARGTSGVLRVVASAPRFRGNEATITVTVDSAGFYETVAFVLERYGVGWRIAKRTQLGIT